MLTCGCVQMTLVDSLLFFTREMAVQYNFCIAP